ncbi:MAG: hypothetical protein Q9190_003001 [Brigantiaea leucoxantha]
MWNQIFGKSIDSKASSQSSRRKENNQPSKPPRSKTHKTSSDRGIEPSSSSFSSAPQNFYPDTASAPIESSRAADANYPINESYIPPEQLRNETLAEQMPKSRSKRDGRSANVDSPRATRTRNEHSSSRERNRSKRERRERRERRDNDTSGRGSGVFDVSSKDKGISRAQESLAVDAGNSDFVSPPGASNGDRLSNSNGHTQTPSSHVQDQFPGQFPAQATAPYRPPLAVNEGGPGLAAEYYGDAGQSVADQPGFRKSSPSLIIGAEPHLQAASAVPAPPPEPSATGGVGAAASFFSGSFDAGSDTESHHASGSVPGLGGTSSQYTSVRPSHGQYSLGNNDSSAGHNSSSATLPPKLVAGVAAGATAGYIVGSQSSSLHHHEHDSSQRHRHRGPLSRLVDFFKDPEGVAQFEEYTEYIGVCKYCFAPGSSPRDAPRKHHYRRRRSNERFGSSSRIDKDSRYWSSEGEIRRRNQKSWAETSLAGFGLANVGQSLLNQENRLDDKYNEQPSRTGKSDARVGAHFADRQSLHSSGVTRRSSNITLKKEDLSQGRVETGITADGKIYRKKSGGKRDRPSTKKYTVRHHSRSRSRSSSRNRNSGVGETALGAVIGASLIGSASRRGSQSPQRRRSRERLSDAASNHKAYNEDQISGRQSYQPRRSSRSKSGRKAKNNRGFFSFSNSSSSSSDLDLAFDTGTDRRKDFKHPKAKVRNSSDANAALIGLGAAATALALSQTKSKSRAHDRMVKQPKGRHDRILRHDSKSDKSSIGSKDDLWESASEGEYSSADSELAYGAPSPWRRSQESLSSSSGLDKWNWRWGDKKQKHSPQDRQRKSDPDPSSAYELSVATGAYQQEGGSSAPLQHVYPIPTSDPSRFDVVGRDSVAPSRDTMTIGRPDPVPIQHPRPVAPVSPAVYTTQAAYEHSYSAPARSTIAAGQSDQTQSSNRHWRDKTDLIEQQNHIPGSFPLSDVSVAQESKRDVRSRRRDSSPIIHSPGYVETSTASRRRSIRDDTSSVRFDLTKEQEDKHRREERRRRKKEVHEQGLSNDSRVNGDQIQAERERRRSDGRTESGSYGSSKGTDPDVPVKVKQQSWAAPAAAGVIAAAIGATIGEELSQKAEEKDNDKHSRRGREERDVEVIVKERHASPESIDSASGFEHRGRSSEQEPPMSVWQAAAKIRRSSSHENYAAYFTPPELLSRSSDIKQTVGANADNEITMYQVPNIISAEPHEPHGHSQSRVYSFPITAEEIGTANRSFPWPVPKLNLVEPTPPSSRDGSVLGDRTPKSHSQEPVEIEVKEFHGPVEPLEPLKSLDSTTTPEVSYEDPRTVEYTVIEPKRHRQDSVDSLSSEINIIEAAPGISSLKYRTAGEQSPQDERHLRENDDDLEFAATLAAGLQDSGFNPSIVIDDPSFRRRDSPPGSGEYGRADSQPHGFVTEITSDSSDIELTSPSPKRSIGELSEHPMPGSFEAEIAGPKAGVGDHREDRASKPVISTGSSAKSAYNTNDETEATTTEPESLKGKRVENFTGEMPALKDVKPVVEKATPNSQLPERETDSTPYSMGDDAVHTEKVVEEPPQDNQGILESLSDDVTSEAVPSTVSTSKEKKAKRKSKRHSSNSNETPSVASGPPRSDHGRESKAQTKKERKGSLFGFFGKSSDAVQENKGAQETPIEASLEDFEEPKTRSKRSKGRDSTHYSNEPSMTLNESAASASQRGEEEDWSTTKKSKGGKEKRRSSENTSQRDSGRITQSLPVESYSLASPDPGPGPQSNDMLTNLEDQASASKVELNNGDTGLVLAATQQSENPLSSPSFSDTHQEASLSPDTSFTQPDPGGQATHELLARGPGPLHENHVLEDASDPYLDSPHQSDEQSLVSAPAERVSPTSKPDSQKWRLSDVQSESRQSPFTSPSPTAIPLRPIRFGRSPSSPGLAKSAFSTPTTSSSVDPPFTPRKRERPHSTEFKSNEFRPMWLLEKHGSRQEAISQEVYPSLPSSHSTSRSSSVHETDHLDQVRHYEPPVSFYSDLAQQERGLYIDTSQHEAQHELLDSQQATPTAASFNPSLRENLPSRVVDQPEDTSKAKFTPEDSTIATVDTQPEERLLHPVEEILFHRRSSSPLRYDSGNSLGHVGITKRRFSSPSRSNQQSKAMESAFGDAALGALIGGSAAAVLKSRSKHDELLGGSTAASETQWDPSIRNETPQPSPTEPTMMFAEEPNDLQKQMTENATKQTHSPATPEGFSEVHIEDPIVKTSENEHHPQVMSKKDASASESHPILISPRDTASSDYAPVTDPLDQSPAPAVATLASKETSHISRSSSFLSDEKVNDVHREEVADSVEQLTEDTGQSIEVNVSPNVGNQVGEGFLNASAEEGKESRRDYSDELSKDSSRRASSIESFADVRPKEQVETFGDFGIDAQLQVSRSVESQSMVEQERRMPNLSVESLESEVGLQPQSSTAALDVDPLSRAVLEEADRPLLEDISVSAPTNLDYPLPKAEEIHFAKVEHSPKNVPLPVDDDVDLLETLTHTPTFDPIDSSQADKITHEGEKFPVDFHTSHEVPSPGHEKVSWPIQQRSSPNFTASGKAVDSELPQLSALVSEESTTKLEDLSTEAAKAPDDSVSFSTVPREDKNKNSESDLDAGGGTESKGQEEQYPLSTAPEPSATSSSVVSQDLDKHSGNVEEPYTVPATSGQEGFERRAVPANDGRPILAEPADVLDDSISVTSEVQDNKPGSPKLKAKSGRRATQADSPKLDSSPIFEGSSAENEASIQSYMASTDTAQGVQAILQETSPSRHQDDLRSKDTDNAFTTITSSPLQRASASKSEEAPIKIQKIEPAERGLSPLKPADAPSMAEVSPIIEGSESKQNLASENSQVIPPPVEPPAPVTDATQNTRGNIHSPREVTPVENTDRDTSYTHPIPIEMPDRSESVDDPTDTQDKMMKLEKSYKSEETSTPLDNFPASAPSPITPEFVNKTLPQADATRALSENFPERTVTAVRDTRLADVDQENEVELAQIAPETPTGGEAIPHKPKEMEMAVDAPSVLEKSDESSPKTLSMSPPVAAAISPKDDITEKERSESGLEQIPEISNVQDESEAKPTASKKGKKRARKTKNLFSEEVEEPSSLIPEHEEDATVQDNIRDEPSAQSLEESGFSKPLPKSKKEKKKAKNVKSSTFVSQPTPTSTGELSPKGAPSQPAAIEEVGEANTERSYEVSEASRKTKKDKKKGKKAKGYAWEDDPSPPSAGQSSLETPDTLPDETKEQIDQSSDPQSEVPKVAVEEALGMTDEKRDTDDLEKSPLTEEQLPAKSLALDSVTEAAPDHARSKDLAPGDSNAQEESIKDAADPEREAGIAAFDQSLESDTGQEPSSQPERSKKDKKRSRKAKAAMTEGDRPLSDNTNGMILNTTASSEKTLDRSLEQNRATEEVVNTQGLDSFGGMSKKKKKAKKAKQMLDWDDQRAPAGLKTEDANKLDLEPQEDTLKEPQNVEDPSIALPDHKKVLEAKPSDNVNEQLSPVDEILTEPPQDPVQESAKPVERTMQEVDDSTRSTENMEVQTSLDDKSNSDMRKSEKDGEKAEARPQPEPKEFLVLEPSTPVAESIKGDPERLQEHGPEMRSDKMIDESSMGLVGGTSYSPRVLTAHVDELASENLPPDVKSAATVRDLGESTQEPKQDIPMAFDDSESGKKLQDNGSRDLDFESQVHAGLERPDHTFIKERENPDLLASQVLTSHASPGVIASSANDSGLTAVESPPSGQVHVADPAAEVEPQSKAANVEPWAMPSKNGKKGKKRRQKEQINDRNVQEETTPSSEAGIPTPEIIHDLQQQQTMSESSVVTEKAVERVEEAKTDYLTTLIERNDDSSIERTEDDNRESRPTVLPQLPPSNEATEDGAAAKDFKVPTEMRQEEATSDLPLNATSTTIGDDTLTEPRRPENNIQNTADDELPSFTSTRKGKKGKKAQKQQLIVWEDDTATPRTQIETEESQPISDVPRPDISSWPSEVRANLASISDEQDPVDRHLSTALVEPSNGSATADQEKLPSEEAQDRPRSTTPIHETLTRTEEDIQPVQQTHDPEHIEKMKMESDLELPKSEPSNAQLKPEELVAIPEALKKQEEKISSERKPIEQNLVPLSDFDESSNSKKSKKAKRKQKSRAIEDVMWEFPAMNEPAPIPSVDEHAPEAISSTTVSQPLTSQESETQSPTAIRGHGRENSPHDDDSTQVKGHSAPQGFEMQSTNAVGESIRENLRRNEDSPPVPQAVILPGTEAQASDVGRESRGENAHVDRHSPPVPQTPTQHRSEKQTPAVGEDHMDESTPSIEDSAAVPQSAGPQSFDTQRSNVGGNIEAGKMHSDEHRHSVSRPSTPQKLEQQLYDIREEPIHKSENELQTQDKISSEAYLAPDLDSTTAKVKKSKKSKKSKARVTDRSVLEEPEAAGKSAGNSFPLKDMPEEDLTFANSEKEAESWKNTTPKEGDLDLDEHRIASSNDSAAIAGLGAGAVAAEVLRDRGSKKEKKGKKGKKAKNAKEAAESSRDTEETPFENTTHGQDLKATKEISVDTAPDFPIPQEPGIQQQDNSPHRPKSSDAFEPADPVGDAPNESPSFKSTHRDSAVHMTEPPNLREESPTHRVLRDSGYPETEASPIVVDYLEPTTVGRKENIEVVDKTEDYQDAYRREPRHVVPPYYNPLEISAEGHPMSNDSTSEAEREVMHPSTSHEDTHNEKILAEEEYERSRKEGQEKRAHDELRDASPVSSTAKDRPSMLFQSSPLIQEEGWEKPDDDHGLRKVENITNERRSQDFLEQAQTSDLPKQNSTIVDARVESLAALGESKDVPKDQRPSLFGGPVGISSDVTSPSKSPFEQDGASRRRLNTITEHSPEESPIHKKNRDLSDVGSPDRGVKSARRTGTPQAISRRRAQSPLNEGSSKGMLSTDELISRLSWPAVDEERHSVDLERSRSRGAERPPSGPPSNLSGLIGGIQGKGRDGERRSASGASDQSVESINAIIRTPEQMRSASGMSNKSNRSSGTPPLRRVDRSASGDLRGASRNEARRRTKASEGELELELEFAHLPSSSTYDPIKDKGKSRVADMTDVYEGYGDYHGSPRSPTRPPSMRRRQSMQVLELEAKLDQLLSENRLLQDAKSRAERNLEDAAHDRSQEINSYRESIETRDLWLHQKDEELAELKQMLDGLQGQVSQLAELNNGLSVSARDLDDHEQRYGQLEADHAQTHQQWQHTTRELEELRQQHSQLSTGMEDIVRHEVSVALEVKNAELMHLRDELESAKEQVRVLQAQILASRRSDDLIVDRDEDYFDTQCQALCQHVQQWVLRFSKFSDMRACYLASEVKDEKIVDRMENAVLDGSDVDIYLADRIKRRDVFMSVVMTMVWDFIFTRYLFGMDREQRQKLKALEKTLSEVGPMSAVHKWRATTLNLLAKRESFVAQRAQDTEAVMHTIYETLATFLPPPPHLVVQIQNSLLKVLTAAVDLSIEMRTQRAEYIMLPPLQPEYDTNGDLARKVYFNASLMNERSGMTSSNEALEQQQAVVRMVLFPLVVKKGDDAGQGTEEIVVCPAQVLVAPSAKDKKTVRVMSAQGGRSEAGSDVGMGNMF